MFFKYFQISLIFVGHTLKRIPKRIETRTYKDCAEYIKASVAKRRKKVHNTMYKLSYGVT